MQSPSRRSQAVIPSTFTSRPVFTITAKVAVENHGCQQWPDELGPLLTYLHDHIHPKLILEIGGGSGGSAWAWHNTPDRPDVLTVTLPDGPLWDRQDDLPEWHTVIFGDSTHLAIVDAVLDTLAGREPDMVFIDGSHKLGDVSFDWKNYALYVPNKGFIVMHDINDFTNHLDLEVHVLWALLKEEYVTRELVSTPGQDNGTGLVWI